MDEYRAFIDRLNAAETFIVASHSSPDGDGIGSTIAMGLLLERMGKQALLYNSDPVPANLRFLPNSDRFVSRIEPDAVFDMAIMVDCAQRKRVSKAFAEHPGFQTVACIDHHLLEGSEADALLLDDSAASAGEVVMRLMKKAGCELDADVALLIYTTLVVDTGFFKYSSTSSHVFALASELVAAGAEPWLVAKHLEESYPAARLKLMAASLSTLEFEFDGHYAHMEVTRDMLARTGATMELSDEYANYPRSVAGVEVSALFREVEEGLVKVSLRSKDVVDVSALARSMGGGGHARAAGVRIRAPMAEAKQRIRDAVAKALKTDIET
jgi:phosphoesterase RecJ-like protein